MTPVSSSDWRLQGQEQFLKGKEFRLRNCDSMSADWDHEHCEFCWAKFSNQGENLKQGYTTDYNGRADAYRWVCEQCFNDFKEQFEWTVIQ